MTVTALIGSTLVSSSLAAWVDGRSEEKMKESTRCAETFVEDTVCED